MLRRKEKSAKRRDGESIIFRIASRLGGALEKSICESRLFFAFFAPQKARTFSLFSRKRMRKREESVFRSLHAAARVKLLSADLRSFGAFLIFLSVFRMTYLWFDVSYPDRIRQILPCAVMLFTALPLVGEERSLFAVTRKSVVFSRLLYGFCGFPTDFPDVSSGKDHRGTALTAAFVWFGLTLAAGASSFVTFASVAGVAVLPVVFALPELCLLAVAAGYPLFHLLPHPTLTLTALSLLLLAAWLPKALCGRRESEFDRTDLAVLLFGITVLGGGITGTGGSASFCESAVLFCLLIAYFPARSMLSDRLWFNRFRVAVSVAALLCAGYGILQYFVLGAPSGWVDKRLFSDLGGRVTSFFSNPNFCAVYLISVLPLSLTGISDRAQTARSRAFFVLCTLSEVFCLVLTWSRGGWLGAVAEFVLFLLAAGHRGRVWAILMPIPCAAVLPFLPGKILRRFRSIFRGDSSTRYRTATWKGAVRLIRCFPFGIGVGGGAFRKIWPSFAVSGTETAAHTHNVFLQILSETGFPGLFAFFSAIFLVFRRAASNRDRTGASFALAGLLVAGMFDHLWYDPGMILYFCLLCAAAGVLPRREEVLYDDGI